MSPVCRPHRHWYRAERPSLPQRWIHVLEVGDGLQEGHGFVLTPCASERIEIMIGRQLCPAAFPLQTALQQLPGDSLHTHSLPFGFCHEPAGGGVIDIINHDRSRHYAPSQQTAVPSGPILMLPHGRRSAVARRALVDYASAHPVSDGKRQQVGSMGYSTVDCKARSWLWLARKHCENSAFEFFDQTPFSGYHERSGLGELWRCGAWESLAPTSCATTTAM